MGARPIVTLAAELSILGAKWCFLEGGLALLAWTAQRRVGGFEAAVASGGRCYIPCNTLVIWRLVRVVRRGTASATQTAAGGPPPCLVIARDLLCSVKALVLRSTRHPLSNHPNKPLAPLKAEGA